MKISLVINTLNEEKNIANCINSAAEWVDEIIVCDMHSEDNTSEIAVTLGARVCLHNKVGFVEPARHFAISQASCEWILVLDADEKLTEKLANKLREIATVNQVDAVSFASLFNYFGGYVYHGGFFNNNWTRFFRKQTYLDTYTQDELAVHKNFDALNQLPRNRRLVLPKEFYILHNAYPTPEKYIHKTVDFYARLEAQQKFDRNEKFSVCKMVYEIIKTFGMTYIVRGGFRDGIRGLVLCIYFTIYRFNIYTNLWFLNQKKTNE